MKTYGLERSFEVNVPGENEPVVVKMKSSVSLLGLYKSYFFSDLLTDLMKFLQKINITDVKKFEGIDFKKDVEEYTAEEAKLLLNSFADSNTVLDTTILTQIIVALMLNAVPASERPGMPDALDIVPFSFLTDQKIISAVIELVTPFVGNSKK